MVVSGKDHLGCNRTEAEKWQKRGKMKSDRGQFRIEDGEE